jgi:hypothetical protein
LGLIGIFQPRDIFTEVEADFADFENEPGSARLPMTASRLTCSAALITRGVDERNRHLDNASGARNHRYKWG